MTGSNAQRSTLRVIDGGAQSTPKWRDFPASLVARSPFDRDRPAHFRLARQDIQKAVDANRRQPIFDCWGCVVGQLPPVNNIRTVADKLPESGLSSIAQAHACYRGIKRPIGNDDTGWDTIVYVSKPSVLLTYEPSLVCVIKSEPVNDDLVFLTCVKLDNPDYLRYQKGERSLVRGVITHWEFVEADPDNTNLPRDHKERFRKRLW